MSDYSTFFSKADRTRMLKILLSDEEEKRRYLSLSLKPAAWQTSYKCSVIFVMELEYDESMNSYISKVVFDRIYDKFLFFFQLLWQLCRIFTEDR